jgi:hypothetical protein
MKKSLNNSIRFQREEGLFMGIRAFSPLPPLTLPSPARGEGKYFKIQEEIPSPSMGEGQEGVKMEFFHTHRGIEGDLKG